MENVTTEKLLLRKIKNAQRIITDWEPMNSKYVTRGTQLDADLYIWVVNLDRNTEFLLSSNAVIVVSSVF